MKTAQETSRVATTKAGSGAALPDMEGWVRFARCAEEAGIESVLLSFSRYEPDTIFVACAVGQATRSLKFIVAYRLGLMQPATFVQQINTLSGVIGGRVSLNIVAGSSTVEQRGYGRVSQCVPVVLGQQWRREFQWKVLPDRTWQAVNPVSGAGSNHA